MNNLVLSAIFSLMVFCKCFAQEPISIAEKFVPKKITNKFKKNHPEISDVKWYPYPYKYKQSKEATPVVFPILWQHNSPNYFEARFKDQKGELRKVYDRTGGWLVSSRPISINDISDDIKTQIKSRGFSDWTIIQVERISKSGVEGKFFKLWLKQDSKTRILYFDERGKFVKTLSWNNDKNFTPKSNTKLKNAPASKRKVNVITASDVPAPIKQKLRKDYAEVEVSQWALSVRVHDPYQFGSSYAYYDVEIPVLYQVKFKSKSGKFIVTYNAMAEVLESAEIITTKKLPKPVREAMNSTTYDKWKFSDEHDKLKVDDKMFVYRVYGILEGKEVYIVLNENGKSF